jgi:hypothetical protein
MQQVLMDRCRPVAGLSSLAYARCTGGDAVLPEHNQQNRGQSTHECRYDPDV